MTKMGTQINGKFRYRHLPEHTAIMLDVAVSPLFLINVLKAALRSADEQTSAKHKFRANSGLSLSSSKAAVRTLHE